MGRGGAPDPAEVLRELPRGRGCWAEQGEEKTQLSPCVHVILRGGDSGGHPEHPELRGCALLGATRPAP